MRTLMYIFILLSTICDAQNNQLNGRVILKSTGKPIVGLAVKAVNPYTNRIEAGPSYTNNSGYFSLIFLDKTSGHSVKIVLVGQDKNKVPIEANDPEVINEVRIPPDKDTLTTIHACVSGKCPDDLVKMASKKVSETICALETTVVTISKKNRDLRKEHENPIKDSINTMLLLGDANTPDASKEIKSAITALSENYDINEAIAILKPQDADKDYKSWKKLTKDRIKNKLKRYELLISLLSFLGRYNEAIYYGEKALTIRKFYNFEHNELVKAHNNLSVNYHDAANYGMALQHQLAALKFSEESGDIDSDCTANIYINMAISKFQQGKYREAIVDFQKSMRYYEEKKDLKNKHLANAYDGLMVTYYFMKDTGAMRKLFNKSLQTYDENDHLSMASAYSNHAVMLIRLMDYNSALINIEHAIIELEQISTRHPLFSLLYSNKGSVLNLLGREKLAKTFFEKAIEMQKKSDSLNINLATVYHNLANLHYKDKKFRTAFEYETKAIKIIEQHPDRDLYYITTSYDYIILYSEALKDTTALLKYLKKHISLYEEHGIKVDTPLYNMYITVAQIYDNKTMMDSAIEYVNKRILLCEKHFSNNWGFLTLAYNRMSLLHNDAGDYKNAMYWNEKSLLALKNEPFPVDTLLAGIYCNRAYFYQQMDSLDQAIDYLNKGIFYLSNRAAEDDMKDIALKRLYSCYIDRGYKFQNKHEYAKSNSDYMSALKLHEDPNLLIMIGNNYYYLVNYKMAISHYEKAFGIDSTVGYNEITSTLGIVYAKDDQMEKAYHAFHQFERLGVNQGMSFRNWALYYCLNNDKEMGIENLHKAIKNGYKDWDWIERDEAFDLIREDMRYKKIIEFLKTNN
jgi:tetratricopeptide (TPR) repeat protein